MLGALAALVLAQAADSAAWTLELAGVPTALARVSLKDGRFVWSEESAFARGKGKEVTVKVDAQGKDARGRVPEGLWFFRRPKPGCVKGFDEVSGREGELCLEPDGRGTALGEKFSATWGDDGVLERLSIRGVEWRRGEAGWVGKNPWANGFPLKGAGAAIALEPEQPGLLRDRNPPRPTGKPKPQGDCMTLARAEIDASGGRRELVLGLVIENDRAWPHAWVRDVSSRSEEDPSVPQGEHPDRVYLGISPPQAAGRLYLDLVSGKATLVRK